MVLEHYNSIFQCHASIVILKIGLKMIMDISIELFLKIPSTPCMHDLITAF